MQRLLLVLPFFAFSGLSNAKPTASISPVEESHSADEICEVLAKTIRLVDAILEDEDTEPLPLTLHESEVLPMHAYQMHLCALESLHALQNDLGIAPMPMVTAMPRIYGAEDIWFLSNMLYEQLRRVADHPVYDIQVADKKENYTDRNTLDIFELACEATTKMHALHGMIRLSPSLVFEQARRASSDLQGVIRLARLQGESDDRDTRVLRSAGFGLHPDGTVFEADSKDKQPADAWLACVQLRNDLNQLRPLLGLPTLKTPTLDAEALKESRWADVFIQTQLILAELNVVKHAAGIRQGTPLGVGAEDKTAGDVTVEISFGCYMLERLVWNYSKS